jgi:hypothetical protein
VIKFANRTRARVTVAYGGVPILQQVTFGFFLAWHVDVYFLSFVFFPFSEISDS